ncbi:MAG: rhodanese-like domain-containing protein [Fimbriimonadaceae bacterium]|nr:rhodanese-like domain-containing protein [Fimbriimonadaceae bacterium]
MDFEISIHELNARLQNGDQLFLLDVREPHELENGTIEGSVCIPMAEVTDRLGEIDRSQEVIVICRTGGRSGRVTEYLAQSGFPRVKNMTGGMNAWATEIDQSMQVY